MTALPTDWLYPPSDGWTLADVKKLPEDCRVEVLDGSLIVNPRPLPIHQRMVRRLAGILESQLPTGWQLETDVDVMLAEDPLDYLSPDIIVFGAKVDLNSRPISGSDVLLAVEVVSRGSRREDRGSKPLAYADAKIPHYWRVEGPASGALVVAVHTFELGQNDIAYVDTGVHTGTMTTELIVPVSIDLGQLTS